MNLVAEVLNKLLITGVTDEGKFQMKQILCRTLVLRIIRPCSFRFMSDCNVHPNVRTERH